MNAHSPAKPTLLERIIDIARSLATTTIAASLPPRTTLDLPEKSGQVTRHASAEEGDSKECEKS